MSSSDKLDPHAIPFLFVVCNVDSQQACKKEILQRYPDLRFSFSRPGFMTFKPTPPQTVSDRWQIKSTFARTFGWTLEPFAGQDPELLAERAVEIMGRDPGLTAVHVWQRPIHSPPIAAHDPSQTLIDRLRLRLDDRKLGNISINASTPPNAKILDMIGIDADRWWLAMHYANAIYQRWPGGIPRLTEKPGVISRAYYKTSEALLWSALPIRSGETCVEIGSAPGGSCQRLLELGLNVIAVDPADLDPRIENNPHLHHIKKRGRDLRHSELRDAKWLIVDSNVAPQHSLDTTRGLVTGRRTHFRGLVITLKMPHWQLADEIPDYIRQVKSWGFRYVKTRHLAFGRQEICLMALKTKSTRRFGK